MMPMMVMTICVYDWKELRDEDDDDDEKLVLMMVMLMAMVMKTSPPRPPACKHVEAVNQAPNHHRSLTPSCMRLLK